MVLIPFNPYCDTTFRVLRAEISSAEQPTTARATTKTSSQITVFLIVEASEIVRACCDSRQARTFTITWSRNCLHNRPRPLHTRSEERRVGKGCRYGSARS